MSSRKKPRIATKEKAQSPRGFVSLAEITKAEWAEIYGREDEPRRVLEKSQALLKLAHRGLNALLTGELDKQVGGVCDVAVYGHSVFYAAEHARKTVRRAFEKWYAPWKEEIASDELMVYFHNLRREVVHEGAPRAVGYRQSIDPMKEFDVFRPILDQLSKDLASKDEVVSLGLSDRIGYGLYQIHKRTSSGVLRAGTVPLPEDLWDNLRTVTLLPEPPRTHLGVRIRDISLQNLATLYLKRLDEFVAGFADFVAAI